MNLLTERDKNTGAAGVTAALIAAPFLTISYVACGENWWVAAPVAVVLCFVCWRLNLWLWSLHETRVAKRLEEAFEMDKKARAR